MTETTNSPQTPTPSRPIRLALVARAVVFDAGAVLLAHQIGAAHTFLPGGQIDPGEPAREALRREIQEEVGIACGVGDYLGAIESHWYDLDGYFGVRNGLQHQIDHYFTASLAGIASGTSPPVQEPHLRFFWSPLDELALHNLLPMPLRTLIPRYAAGDCSPWWDSYIEEPV